MGVKMSEEQPSTRCQPPNHKYFRAHFGGFLEKRFGLGYHLAPMVGARARYRVPIESGTTGLDHEIHVEIGTFGHYGTFFDTT